MVGLIALASLTVTLAFPPPPQFTLGLGPFVVSGKVTSARGRLPEKLQVMIHYPTPRGADSVSVPIAADGTFTARGLGSGTYLLVVAPSRDGPDDHPVGYERGFATVTIKDADVNGVAIALAPGVTVRGRVRFDETRPGSARPALIVVHAALALTEWTGPFESAKVAEDGTFEIADVRGPRIFKCGWQLGGDRSYWIPARILLGERDITNVPIDFSREPATEVVVVFRQRATAIVGLVEDVAGLPASVCVAMLPEDPELQRGWSTAVGTHQSDDRGRFYFTNMPPGNYMVAALDRTTCPPPNVVVGGARALARRATRVTVTDDTTARIVISTAPPLPQP